MQRDWARMQGLLLLMDGRQAHDKRDYVYGFLGLLDAKSSPAVVVDYKLPPSSIFTSAVRLACLTPNGVEFWCHLVEVYAGASRSRTLDLPSWCPDLSSRAQHTSGWPFGAPPPFLEHVRVATKDHKSITFGERDGICIAGVEIDEVEESAPLAAYARPTKDYADSEVMADHYFSSHHEQWLEEMATLFPAHGLLQQRWLRKYFYADTEVSVSDHKRRFDAFRLACRRVRSQDAGSTLEAFERLDLPESVRDCLAVDVQVYSLHNGRFFFRTKGGRIGFSPQPPHAGDRICFVGGANYFHVLSADCGRWVTFASLEGRWGETILSLLQRPGAWQTFELR
ncbi:hypothetical protein B0A55_13203 [Friedmanniomyces simplex]|uniref:Heterokaryon incompatibility domain-containing protein n=1 Tax=Friedmanniomyces simplex TaxID=329884 RepID=A0A4U0VZ67_9PEZI|nr:hypothetical protein B0A55_13203 [Friedmanniomyces simplex]